MFNQKNCRSQRVRNSMLMLETTVITFTTTASIVIAAMTIIAVRGSTLRVQHWQKSAESTCDRGSFTNTSSLYVVFGIVGPGWPIEVLVL